jgi:arsenate reductase-like glutaredoxin family protein
MSSIQSRNLSQALVQHQAQLALTSSKQSGLSQSELKTLASGSSRELQSLVREEPSRLRSLAKSSPQAFAHLSKSNPQALQELFKGDSKGLQTLLNALGGSSAPVPAGPTGIVVDQQKHKVSGSAQSTLVDGQRMVDIPGFGSMPAPDPGKVSSFLLTESRLMSLETDANGLVKVNTRELGLESKGSGFKGDVLPDPMTGKVALGDKEIDVSGLKPGQTKTVKIKIKGKKYKVKLRMNADGSVRVEGKRRRGFFGSIIHGIGKAISVVGKFAPLLMAIPGAGLAAVIGKAISVASSVKGFIDSVRTGNFLGAFGSLAGAVAGFASGAVSSVANTLSKVANFGQSVVDAFKYGLGKGLLPIVANGANLLSGAAGIFGKDGLANVAGQVADYASVVDSAFKGNFGPALQKLVNQFGPDIIKQIKEQQKKGVEYFFHEGVKIKPSEFALPDFDWSKAEFSTPPGTVTRTHYDSSTVPAWMLTAQASADGVLYAADTRTPEQKRRDAGNYALQVGKKLNDYGGFTQSFLDNQLFFTRTQPTLNSVGKASMTLVQLTLARSNLSTTFTSAIAEMKLQQQAAFRAGDTTMYRQLDQSIKTLIRTRDSQVGLLNRSISTTSNFLNRNLQTLNSSPAARYLKGFGDVLNRAGVMNGPQSDLRSRAIASAMKGGGNYFTVMVGAAVPPAGLAIAADGLLFGGNVSGTMNSLIDTGVGLVEAVGGNWDTLQKVYEQNRSGANGPVIQKATELGDLLNRVLFGG